MELEEARTLSKEELLEMIEEEKEILTSVYGDYDVVIEDPKIIEEDETRVTFVLDIRPATGIDAEKNGLLAHCKFEFYAQYPFVPPTMQFVVAKGLEQE